MGSSDMHTVEAELRKGVGSLPVDDTSSSRDGLNI